MRDRRLAGLAAAIVIGLGASGALVWQGSEAAFTASASNPSNSWASGTVALTNSQPGSALFNVTALVPGNTATKCITVSYTGNVNAEIRMYATSPSASNQLAKDLDLEISTSAAASGTADPGCTGSYSWGAPLVTTLDAFNGKIDYATGTLVPAWTSAAGPQYRAYKIKYTLNTASNAQTLTAGTTFTWEARNS
jgi:hypothetical protein